MRPETHQLVTDNAEVIEGPVFDRGTIERVEITDAGFVRAPAWITRTGVFVYLNADGSERRELRLPEEVFAPDSLNTLALVPLTREHPMPLGTPVTTDNRKDLDVGVVGSDVRQEGEHIAATVQVEDSSAIADVQSGKRRELSAGYTRRLELTPGSYNGIAYHGIQRSIRYNHVALTQVGRAGPDDRLRLDSSAAVMVCDARDREPTEVTPMKRKIVIDGITYEIDCEDSTLAVITKAIGDRDERLATTDSKIAALTKERDEQRARADTAEAEKKKAEELVADSAKPEKVAELVKNRLDLERTAKPLLVDEKGQEPDLATVEDIEIMKRVILVHDSEAKLVDVSDEYLKMRYDFTVAELKNRATTTDALRSATNPAPIKKPNDVTTDTRTSQEKLRDESMAGWQKPLGPRSAEA